MDHFDVDLFIAEAYFVLEEGSAEGPFLHMQVYNCLEALRLVVPAEGKSTALGVQVYLGL